MFNAVGNRLGRVEWIVLAIDAMLLTRATCQFYLRKAASVEYTRTQKSYRSICAFEEMFEDCIFRKARYRRLAEEHSPDIQRDGAGQPLPRTAMFEAGGRLKAGETQ